RAIESLQQATRLKPDLAEAQYNLGFVFSKKGRAKLAIKSYEQALLLKPDFAEAHNNLAIIYVQQGDRARALEQYTLLKAIDYELAQKLFAMIFKDKILTVGSRSGTP
ncbi:MAG TPA: tetratricopeptide repeat protein, partial [Pyrinomonadaceae bacterium]